MTTDSSLVATVSFSNRSVQPTNLVPFIMLLWIFAAAGVAQQAPQRIESNQDSVVQSQPQSSSAQESTIAVPAGTRLALVLSHPVDSKTTHRGDDVYAQTTAPVVVNDQVAIPAGTFVQAKVDRLSRRGSRGELAMQSVMLIFPNGYVADLKNPGNVESEEGTAFNNPNAGTSVGAFAAPAIGTALGAGIGAAAHTTHTTTFAGTTLTSPTPTGLAVGSVVGLAGGIAVSLVLLAHSHSFYVDEGSAMTMVLAQPLTIAKRQVTGAGNSPPIAVKHSQPSPTFSSTDHGTCTMSPGTPGTPDIYIPGTPIGDSPGTPGTIIPGTPPTPPLTYPCP